MVISGRRSRVHKGLLHGTARGPELDDLRAHRIKIDATRASEYSAFGSSNSEMTQPSSAIIVAIKISMEYARLCMSMRRATPAIRHERAASVSSPPGSATAVMSRGWVFRPAGKCQAPAGPACTTDRFWCSFPSPAVQAGRAEAARQTPLSGISRSGSPKLA